MLVAAVVLAALLIGFKSGLPDIWEYLSSAWSYLGGKKDNLLHNYQDLIGGLFIVTGGASATFVIFRQIKTSEQQHKELIDHQRFDELQRTVSIYNALKAEIIVFKDEFMRAKSELNQRNEVTQFYSNQDWRIILIPHKTHFRDYAWDYARYLDQPTMSFMFEFVKQLAEYRILLSSTKDSSDIYLSIEGNKPKISSKIDKILNVLNGQESNLVFQTDRKICELQEILGH